MPDDEALIAAIYEEVVLQPHDPVWATMFQAERMRLLSLFPSQFIDIQHIGSTAVPGLPAKPIVDLLAGVRSMEVADELIALLCGCGYVASAEFNEKLIDSRWLMRTSGGHRTHHLHVAVHGSEFWLKRLRFRDALLMDAELAARYARLKSDLASRHRNDREAYTDAKAEFIDAASKAA